MRGETSSIKNLLTLLENFVRIFKSTPIGVFTVVVVVFIT